ALGSCQDQVGGVLIGLDLDDLGDALLRLEFQQIGHVLATRGAGGLRQLIGLEAVDTAEVGEEEDPVVGGADEEVTDDIILLQLSTADTLATALLGAVGIDLGALGVTGGGDGDNHILPGDEVFLGDIAGGGDDLG